MSSDSSEIPTLEGIQESGEQRENFLHGRFFDSELVLGLVGAVGTELEKVRQILEDKLKVIGYSVLQIRVTKEIIPGIMTAPTGRDGDEYDRINGLMDAGNEARLKSGDNSILALGVAAFINSKRALDAKQSPQKVPQHAPRRAYIISSLKHPDEVSRLRELYPEGFYLIGVHADERRRLNFLTKDKGIPDEKAKALVGRDEDEHLPHGQKVTETFHLSDFFVRIDGQDDHLNQSVWRILDLLFGNPFVTPTFDEYAMFMAFAASLRSADLSRQVGAVIARDEQVLASGANECPKANGGTYWSDGKLPKEADVKNDGRDYKLGYDSNKIEQQKIIDEIVGRAANLGLDGSKVREALSGSRITDLTEFGRTVHAEMEALLSCGRARILTKGGTLYSTTFPCHNCAKHIVAAGIKRVVFIEPYQKSKAAELHKDSIRVGFTENQPDLDSPSMVHFEPFVGVGPRRFFDLFSIRLGSGYPLKRKDPSGKAITWVPNQGRLRLQMLPVSYLDLELIASAMFLKARGQAKE